VGNHTSFTDSKKKNKGSTEIATKQQIAKNLFHCCTSLLCGFITLGTCGIKTAKNLLAQSFASP